MKKLILLSVFILIFSCDSNEDKNNSSYALIRFIEFKVASIDGVDLLNPINSNAYKSNFIKIYNLIEGNIVEVFNQSSTIQRDFKIVSPEDSGIEEYFIRVYINNPELENAVTYIKWNETETDTIKSNSVANGNSLILTKVWYNDELILDGNTKKFPEIIKTKD